MTIHGAIGPGSVIKVRLLGHRVWINVIESDAMSVTGVLQNQIADEHGLRWGDDVRVPRDDILPVD